ncbi:MAG TPA: NADH-quinone oxidoreductase subunit K [Pirellulales bacterium]
MNPIADFLLIVVLIINLTVLGTGRLMGCIRQVAAQGMALGVLTLFVTEHPWDLRIWFIAAVSFALKGWVFPLLLMRSLRTANVQHESAPIVGYAGSIACGILVVIASFWMAQQFSLPLAHGAVPLTHKSIANAVLPFALATIVSGLFLIVTRRQALMQVLGYIVLENGIFIFGVALAHEEPVLVEMGILLDVFVGVFVMGIAVFHIGREFDHIDVRQLSQLRD